MRISIMTGIRCLLSLLFVGVLTAEAGAQFIPPITPFVGVPAFIPNGVGLQYSSRRLNIGGFVATGGGTVGILPIAPNGMFFPQGFVPQFYYPPGPFFFPTFPPLILGQVNTRFNLQVINPPGLGMSQRFPGQQQVVDLSGIDLDSEPASRLWDKPGAGVARERDQARKPEPKAPRPMPPPDPVLPPPAKVPAGPDIQRLLDGGSAAFRNGDYGIAILRFRQLSDGDPPVARSIFLLGSAYIATGKYKEAAQAIQRGLDLQPGWVQSGFRPRVELYDNDDDRWKQHLGRLEQAQKQNPNSADHLFLLGYLAWFDGKQDAAVAYFKQSRDLANDRQWADLFLKAPQVKVGAK
jgi:hypothetical protein